MKKRNAFTLVELLVVISIIALLVGILLPALSRARDAAMVNSSKNNIRNIYMANSNYNQANKGRQWVGAPSDLAKHGDTIGAALNAYLASFGAYDNYGGGDAFDGWAPGPGVQFGETHNGTVWFCGNVPEYVAPYLWASGPTSTQSAQLYGTYLHPNTRQIAEYMEDQIINKAYYAPKDTIILDALEECFSHQGNLCPGDANFAGGDYADFDIGQLGSYGFPPMIPPTSYMYSAANMMNPKVLDFDPDESNGGFRDPCTFNSGFMAPTLDQSKYASLKAYLIEQHWLQNVTGESCSPTWQYSPYSWRDTNNDDGFHWGGCYPALFNHSFRSTPVCLFNEGHVDVLDVNAADKSDNIVALAHKDEYGTDNNLSGTWHRGTPSGDNGWWHEAGTDWMDVSCVVLTTYGSNGRDLTAEAVGVQ